MVKCAAALQVVGAEEVWCFGDVGEAHEMYWVAVHAEG